MPTASPDDVSMYEEVCRLLEAEEQASLNAERRVAERSAYIGWQLLAPYRGRRLQQSEFKFVHCRDLSCSGFSFITEQDERSDEFVIALGTAPFKFFVARVANRRWTVEQGEKCLIVGCRFVRGLV